MHFKAARRAAINRHYDRERRTDDDQDPYNDEISLEDELNGINEAESSTHENDY